MIHRSILRVLPYLPIHLAGLACFPVPWYVCLSGGGVRAELLDQVPLCLGHGVADELRRTLVMYVLMLPPEVGVATCALGDPWMGARVCIPRPQGLQSIYLLASPDQLKAVAGFSSGYLLWL